MVAFLRHGNQDRIREEMVRAFERWIGFINPSGYFDLHEKKKEKQGTSQNLNSKQRLALHALQNQLNILRLKELLMVLGFIFGAALLRVPMQALPSAEPITFLLF